MIVRLWLLLNSCLVFVISNYKIKSFSDDIVDDISDTCKMVSKVLRDNIRKIIRIWNLGYKYLQIQFSIYDYIIILA